MRQKIITLIVLCMALLPFAPLRADMNGKTGPMPTIALPSDSDDYAKLVARAAAHDTTVDFRALRLAYLKSAARSREDSDAVAAQQKQLFAAVAAEDAIAIRDNAIKLLSMDYINMYGHMMLRQSCAFLHDDACTAREHFVEFGLLNSVVDSGNGKSCQSGWEVVTIHEEYFVLDMLGAHLKQQALVHDGHGCDAMTVDDRDGKEAVYYFNADAVLADEAAMFAPK